MVGHLRAEAHVLVLPQPSACSSCGGEAGLDVVEEEANNAEEANGLAGKGLQIGVKAKFISVEPADKCKRQSCFSTNH